jgi:uncharacterized protein YjbJ (UPF0337 family)
MNENTFDGGLKSTAGKIESTVGYTFDRPRMQARGEARRAEGKLQQLFGTVQDSVSRAADKVSETVARIGGQGRDVYGQTADRARKVAQHVDPFVKDQPYVALAMVAAIGLLVGLLIAGRGPKIIYIKRPD